MVGVITAMVEKELGERNFCFDSLKSRLKRDMEEKGFVAECGLPEELLRHRRRSLHTTGRSEQWSVGEMTWTRNGLTAVY